MTKILSQDPEYFARKQGKKINAFDIAPVGKIKLNTKKNS